MTKIATIGMKTTAAAISAANVADPMRLLACVPLGETEWAVPVRGNVDKRSALANAGMVFL
ncbi:MAG: hypothetical protein U5N27_23610 [Rhizobium sp.]|nr:hypothetical protein [Rhizobium sp.]MDM8016204.1 hypothetical protein [Rhizobium sp.]MDZ7875807.1 hypothetical protein [Rhizobium sp.]